MFRFFSGGTDLEAAARLMLDVDYAQRYGLVAVRGASDEVVAHGNYFGVAPGQAEIAFAIARGLQGLGLGTLLLAHLAEVAQDNGISMFTAEVMPENHRMIEVFRESGFPAEMSSRPGTIHVELPTSLSDEAVAHFEDRDRIAAQAAIRPFLEPRAVAVIGASREHGTVGGQLFHNALEAGFEGVVYPVNPSADVVQSVRAYPTVTDVPDEVDLAVIAVPAITVEELKQKLDSGDRPTLLDVREPHEWPISDLPESVKIPLGQLQQRFSELTQDADLVVYCRTGGRSAQAVQNSRSTRSRSSG